MKILSASQIRALDAYTIEHEPIASIDLMERASKTFVDWFVRKFDYVNQSVHIFCGPGNNGGDGLAIGRMLHQAYYKVTIYLCKIGNSTSEDFDINLARLPKHQAIQILEIQKGDQFPEIPSSSIIIDGIFGSGLNRAVEGYWASCLDHLNKQKATRVAIDIPSGLFADQSSSGTSFQAHFIFSFELPKLAFFFPENYPSVGEWYVKSIGLHPHAIEKAPSSYFYIDKKFVASFLKVRKKYDHKGTYGHALIIAGSRGMVGASLLSSRAALRAGSGLVSLHCPKVAYNIVQTAIPEVMISLDSNESIFTSIPDLKKYNSLGIGPGIGTQSETKKALTKLLETWKKPMVLDADALNLLAQEPALLKMITKNSIISPHPKEFERLFGGSPNDFERNKLQIEKAKELGIFIILKGAHTCIADPNGNCYFNSTGNPGMATAGSGDVLTGILTSLLAQGYTSKEAAILGVYLHGLAGDLALDPIGSPEALIAGDIIDFLGSAYREIRST